MSYWNISIFFKQFHVKEPKKVSGDSEKKDKETTSSSPAKTAAAADSMASEASLTASKRAAAKTTVTTNGTAERSSSKLVVERMLKDGGFGQKTTMSALKKPVDRELVLAKLRSVIRDEQMAADVAAESSPPPTASASKNKKKKKKNKSKNKNNKGSPPQPGADLKPNEPSVLDDDDDNYNDDGDEDDDGGGCGMCPDCLKYGVGVAGGGGQRSASPPRIWHEHELKKAINMCLDEKIAKHLLETTSSNGEKADQKQPKIRFSKKLDQKFKAAMAMSLAECDNLGQFMELPTKVKVVRRLGNKELDKCDDDEDDYEDEDDELDGEEETEEQIYCFEEIIDELDEHDDDELADPNDQAALDLLSTLVKSSWTKRPKAAAPQQTTTNAKSAKGAQQQTASSRVFSESLKPVERKPPVQQSSPTGTKKLTTTAANQKSQPEAAVNENNGEKTANKKKKKKKKTATANANQPNQTVDQTTTKTTTEPNGKKVAEVTGQQQQKAAGKKGQNNKVKNGAKQQQVDTLEDIDELVRELTLGAKSKEKKATGAGKNGGKQPEPAASSKTKNATAANKQASSSKNSQKQTTTATATTGARKPNLDESKASTISSSKSTAAKSRSSSRSPSNSSSRDSSEQEEEVESELDDSEQDQDDDDDDDEEHDSVYELSHMKNNPFCQLETSPRPKAAVKPPAASSSSLKGLDSFRDTSLNDSSDFDDDLPSSGNKKVPTELPVPHSVDEEEVMLKKALELSLKETQMKQLAAEAKNGSSQSTAKPAAASNLPSQTRVQVKGTKQSSKLNSIDAFSDDDLTTMPPDVKASQTQQQQKQQQPVAAKNRAAVKHGGGKSQVHPAPQLPSKQTTAQPKAASVKLSAPVSAPVASANQKPKSFAAAVAASTTTANKAAAVSERKSSLPEATNRGGLGGQQPPVVFPELPAQFNPLLPPPNYLPPATANNEDRVKSVDLLLQQMNNPLMFLGSGKNHQHLLLNSLDAAAPTSSKMASLLSKNNNTGGGSNCSLDAGDSLLGNGNNMASLFPNLVSSTSSLLGDLIPNTFLGSSGAAASSLQLDSLLTSTGLAAENTSSSLLSHYDTTSQLLSHHNHHNLLDMNDHMMTTKQHQQEADPLFSSLPSQLSSLTNVTSSLFSDTSSLLNLTAAPQYSNSLASLDPTDPTKFLFDIGSIIGAGGGRSADMDAENLGQIKEQSISPALNKPIGSGRPLSNNSALANALTPVRSTTGTPDIFAIKAANSSPSPFLTASDSNGAMDDLFAQRIKAHSLTAQAELLTPNLNLHHLPQQQQTRTTPAQSPSLTHHLLSMPPPSQVNPVSSAAMGFGSLPPPPTSSNSSTSSSVSTSSSATPSPLNRMQTSASSQPQQLQKPAQKQTIRVQPLQRATTTAATAQSASPSQSESPLSQLSQLQNLSIEELNNLVAFFLKNTNESAEAIIQLLEKCIAQKQHQQQQFPPLSTTLNPAQPTKTVTENDPLKPAPDRPQSANNKPTNVWNNPPGSNPLLSKMVFTNTAQNVSPSMLAASTTTKSAPSPPVSTTPQPAYGSTNGYYDHFGNGGGSAYEHFPTPAAAVKSNGFPSSTSANITQTTSSNFGAVTGPAFNQKIPLPNLAIPPPSLPPSSSSSLKSIPPGMMLNNPGAQFPYQYFNSQQQQQQQPPSSIVSTAMSSSFPFSTGQFDQFQQLSGFQPIGTLSSSPASNRL